MGRRFLNTGISNAYGIFRENQFRFNTKVIRYIFIALIFYLKKRMEYLLKRDMKYYFSMMQRKGELAFWINRNNFV